VPTFNDIKAPASSKPLPWENKQSRLTPEQEFQKSLKKDDKPATVDRSGLEQVSDPVMKENLTRLADAAERIVAKKPTIKAVVKPKKKPMVSKGKVKPIDKPAPKRESITPKAKPTVIKTKAVTPIKSGKMSVGGFVQELNKAVGNTNVTAAPEQKKGDVNAGQKKAGPGRPKSEGKTAAQKPGKSAPAKGAPVGKAAADKQAAVKKEVNKPKTMKKIIDAVSDRKASPKEIGKKVADIVVEAKNVATNKEIVINAKNTPVQDKKVPAKALQSAEKPAPKKVVHGKGNVSAHSSKAKPVQSGKAAGKAGVKAKK
jgi:heparin binding hemagglutinin HbhA